MRVGSKWKICLVGVIVLIQITDIVGQQHPGGGHGNKRPGRKFRVPGGYEVQFGTWPLMEVTKLQKLRAQYNSPKSSLGGFMQNAIHSNFNKKPPHGHKFQHYPNKLKFRGGGPPPPPINGKPVFFADIKSPLPPLPPPQPNGGPIGIPIPLVGGQIPHHLPNSNILFQNGPLPVKVVQIFQAPTTTTTTTEAPLPMPPPMSSVMGKAAYSGFFAPNFGSNNVQSFGPSHGPRPWFPPNHHHHHGPPPQMIHHRPPVFLQPQTSHSFHSHQFRHPVSGSPVFFTPPSPPVVVSDPVLPPMERLFQMNKVPQVPPTIQIGNHPPTGYSMTHGEQQLITLKLPDVKMGKKMDSMSLLRGAEFQSGPGTNRRQDFFNKPRNEDKKLPDVGAIYTVNMVLQTPNISAPMNGSDSPHFYQGIEQMARIYGKPSSSPLDGQVKLLGKLFTELQRIKPGKSRVVDEPSYTVSTTTTNSDPFGVQSAPQKTYYTPKVDAPLLAVHIQSYSVPEPGSSDPDVLDSARMFGLQGHKIEFGSTNEIINLMDAAQKSVGKRIPLEELGYSRGEVNHNLQEWVRSYVTLTRKMKDQAHSKGEGIASSAFKQHQVHLRMPDNSMQAMDPKVFSQGASITNAGAVATYQG